MCIRRKARPDAVNALASIRPLVPFERCQVDLIGEIWKADKGKEPDFPQFILSVICCFSRYPSLRALRRKTAEEIGLALLDVFLDQGCFPLVVQTDSGREFWNDCLAQMFKALKVKQAFAPSYSPHVSGISESSHKKVQYLLSSLMWNVSHEFKKD